MSEHNQRNGVSFAAPQDSLMQSLLEIDISDAILLIKRIVDRRQGKHWMLLQSLLADSYELAISCEVTDMSQDEGELST